MLPILSTVRTESTSVRRFSRISATLLSAVFLALVLSACNNAQTQTETSASTSSASEVSSSASNSSDSSTAASSEASSSEESSAQNEASSSEATQAQDAEKRAVRLGLDITGGVEADKEAVFPIHVRGTDTQGNSVDETFAVNLEGDGLELAPGTYSAVLSSGTAFADNGLVRITSENIILEVPNQASGDEPYTPEKRIAVDLITNPGTVTDAELQSAHGAAIDCGVSVETADRLLAEYTELRDANIDLLSLDNTNRADVEAILLARATRLGPLAIDAPYYTISLPDAWLNNYTFEYVEPRLVVNADGTGMGCEIEVLRGADVSIPGSDWKITNEDFHVALVTNGYVPAGDNIAVDLPTPSNLPGWHVIVYGPRANAFSGEMARFASYVTVK
ncbi:MAG: hypothetical protein IJ125_00350 [Atopobiaceae bacterium]|nr:hypothetical protein [Atopobiaceae bacterium]